MDNNLKYVLMFVGIVVVGFLVYYAVGDKVWNEEMVATEYEMLDRSNYGVYSQNIDNEDGSYGDFMAFVIDNDADWKGFWESYIRDASTGGFEKEPRVNFESEIVVAMLQGIKNSGGYYLNTESVEQGENTLSVSVALFEPGEEDVNTQVVSSPYEVIKMQKSNILVNNKYVRFVNINKDGEIVLEKNINELKFNR